MKNEYIAIISIITFFYGLYGHYITIIEEIVQINLFDHSDISYKYI